MAVHKCLTEGCERLARTRGVCTLCYGRFYTLIRDGSSSFESLEAAGKLLPSGASRSKVYHRRLIFGAKST